MKELTDEQYAKIGNLVYDLGWPGPTEGVGRGNTRLGRAAYAASFPYAVAEALVEPSNDEMFGPYSWHEGNKQHVRSMFATRLARLTAKPDPAVEAVAAICKEYDAHTRYEGHQEFIAKIVAAVDEARKGAK